MTKQQLNENLEQGDLKRLVHSELHIDEYKSKMGTDDAVCVVSFKVGGKEAAGDLMSFIEKGYDWVLDSDVSSGEKEGGDYLVFVEMDRRSTVPENIMAMVDDINNLTEQDISDWRFRYHKSHVDHELTLENLQNTIPLTPQEYRAHYDQQDKELDELKLAAGIDVDTTAPVNEYTENLRVAAGIK